MPPDVMMLNLPRLDFMNFTGMSLAPRLHHSGSWAMPLHGTASLAR